MTFIISDNLKPLWRSRFSFSKTATNSTDYTGKRKKMYVRDVRGAGGKDENYVGITIVGRIAVEITPKRIRNRRLSYLENTRK